MLLAIDVGNTHVVCGLWDGARWVASWRKATSVHDTEDELAAWLKSMFVLSGIEWRVDAGVCASVVPSLESALVEMCARWLGVELWFLRTGQQVGIEVVYEPPTAVGADRLANAVGALALVAPPIVVVDFGTATTFDAIDAQGRYVGGAIVPGVQISSQALFERTAKLPSVAFAAPSTAIGRNTTHSLQSGIMFGYADAIDGLAGRISSELQGETTVIATGGLGGLFYGLCKSISRYEPNLTLDGLRLAYERSQI
jgi:type III pantothenate kinase